MTHVNVTQDHTTDKDGLRSEAGCSGTEVCRLTERDTASRSKVFWLNDETDKRRQPQRDIILRLTADSC